MGLFTINTNKDFSIIINRMDEVEFTDARAFLKNLLIRSIVPTYIHYIERLLGFCPKSLFGHIIHTAKDVAEKRINELEKVALPHQLDMLLEGGYSKKEQIQLLKGVSLSVLEIGGLFVQAGNRGYTFSNYYFEGTPKEFKEKDLPSFINIKEDGNISTYGKTSLSNGQLKDFVIKSDFIIARILDKGKHWHCFYQTKRGIQGKEHGKYGSLSHIHFFSDSFGVSREDFVKALKGGNGLPTKVHIIITDN